MTETAPPRLITPRLVGRPPRDSDFMNLREIFADPRAMRWLSADGAPQTESKTRALLDLMSNHWLTHNFGPWMFETQAGDFIGYGGLRLMILNGRAEAEVLYGLKPAFWRQGYGTEMAKAIIANGLQQQNLREMVCFTLVENIGSRRVMESAGFEYQNDFTHVGLPHALYRLTVR